ncbi:MAG: flavodoxin family protein [Anaerolineaceae bacterium]|nr:flavodoxin family protein [Anaerolineaceae bacterium]
MIVTILNGNYEPSGFDTYLNELSKSLEEKDCQVVQLDLREMDLRYCTGCFDCWKKTPGRCQVEDASYEIDRQVINSDFIIWASPLKKGFPTALLKKSIDKLIPLIHPYFEVVNNEAHHRPRYDKYPKIALLIEKESNTDDEDLNILKNIFSRTALNFKSQLSFMESTEIPAEKISTLIIDETHQGIPIPKRPEPTQGLQIKPPKHLTIFNGSPRGAKGNTPIVLGKFLDGFTSNNSNTYEIHQLNKINQREKHVEAFYNAECVIIGFPLYTDAMPAIVKDFIEQICNPDNRSKNPPMGFMVQSGFPEAAHSRFIEQYLQKLAATLGVPYLGTMVRGGVEGIQIMPDNMTKNLFKSFFNLGNTFASDGVLDPRLLKKLVNLEAYPAILTPFFKLFTRLPFSSIYWDNQLKQNGVFEERFAKPFLKKTDS